MLPTATFVGGGFIVGLAEAVYTPTMGLTWAVIPVTAATSFIVGRTVFFVFRFSLIVLNILIFLNKTLKM